MQKGSLSDVLKSVANQYPPDMVSGQLKDIPRIKFNIDIGLRAIKSKRVDEVELCDMGGGVGMFSVGCAAYGMKRVVLADDFDDEVNHRVGTSIFDVHKSHGVEVVPRDVVAKGISDLEGHFDIITTFDSMEHWHNSPKKLFQDVINKLKPGGAFVLGVPNCVNMRKRVTVPFGVGKWSSMKAWYEDEIFRGHVREPDVGDIKYIAHDMGLNNIRIYGRNWQGYYSPHPATRLAAKIMDYPLRVQPTFCSDIYLVGTKS